MRTPPKRRNPIAKALRVVRPKVVRSRVKYTRKPKHKDNPGDTYTASKSTKGRAP